MPNITIEITPLDTLFFRDGKPFTQGDDSHLETINFPPAPSVFLGAIKTMLAAYQDWSLTDINTNCKELKISKVYLKIDDEICFTPPADIIKIKQKDKSSDLIKKINTQKLDKLVFDSKKYQSINSLFATNAPTEYAENVGKYAITQSDLYSYLLGDNLGEYIDLKPILFETEYKIGIKRNTDTHTAQDSMLYSIAMLRTQSMTALKQENNETYQYPEKSIQIYIDIDYINQLPSSGYLRLGGEGKVATYKIIENLNNEDNEVFLTQKKLQNISFFEKTNQFKIYLNTPAFFKNGWQPDLKTTLGINATLVAANIGKPISIGGFNMQTINGKKKGHKSMYRAVPAGAVYIYEVKEEDKTNIAKILTANQGISICDIGDAQKVQEGFGIAFFGNP